MEKGISNFYEYYKETLGVDHVNPESYSPLSLAYIGDSVFDLMIRTMIVSRANMQVEKYHNTVTKLVCASAQAKMMRGIRDRLTEEEHAIYKRGRNANFNTKAKNASFSDYRYATAFEAVLGFLYLNEDFIRLFDVVKMSIEVLQQDDPSIKFVPMIKPISSVKNQHAHEDLSIDEIEKNDDFDDENEQYFEHDKDDSKWDNVIDGDNDDYDDVNDDKVNISSSDSYNQDYEEDGSGD